MVSVLWSSSLVLNSSRCDCAFLAYRQQGGHRTVVSVLWSSSLVLNCSRCDCAFLAIHNKSEGHRQQGEHSTHDTFLRACSSDKCNCHVRAICQARTCLAMTLVVSLYITGFAPSAFQFLRCLAQFSTREALPMKNLRGVGLGITQCTCQRPLTSWQTDRTSHMSIRHHDLVVTEIENLSNTSQL